MQTGTATGDGERVVVTPEAYDRLRQAAATYRESLVVRLCGEVGLRPPEIARVTPDAFSTRTTRNGTHHLLSVVDGDGGSSRAAYVPTSVRSAVRRYVNDRDVASDEPIVAITPRRIQMIVGEVSTRAADEFGEERLRHVSSQELCRYYARRLVHREGVDTRIVQAVGPWESLDTLRRHLDPVDVDAVVSAFEQTGVSGPSGLDPSAAIGAAVADAEFGVVVVGPDGLVQYANDGFAALTEREDDCSGRAVASLYAGDEPAHPTETSGPDPVRLHAADDETVPAVRVVTPRSTPEGRGGYVAAFMQVDDGESLTPSAEDATPARLTAAIDVLEGATEELSAASKRPEVASRVCERLAANDGYEFAWVGSETGDRGVVSTAWDGIDDPTAEGLAETATETLAHYGDRPAATEDLRILGEDSDGQPVSPLGGDGNDADPPAASIALIPIVYGDTTHGLLALGTDDQGAFETDEQRVLSCLGWQVGQTMTDIERRNLLLADSVTELEFRVESERAFFVAASERLGATFELQGLVPGEGQTLLYFVRMSDTTPETVFEYAADAESIENARLIRDYGDTYLVEFVVGGEEPATTLTDLGGHVTDFGVEGGAQRITAEFTTETNVRAVFNGFQTPFPESSLFSKQEVERPIQTTDGFRRSLEDDLTSKQQSVLRAAYLAGYFEWPRGSTAEELADSIGVSSPTLHNHLRKAQQKVLTAFFDESE